MSNVSTVSQSSYYEWLNSPKTEREKRECPFDRND